MPKPTTLCAIAAGILFIATSASAATHTIFVGQDSQGNPALSFSPSTITIPAGDTITFVSNDPNIPHNAVADDGSFNSGNPSTGPWTFTTSALATGTHTFHCVLHVTSGMTGSITVQATPVKLQSFDVK